jgi:hypothetical protein
VSNEDIVRRYTQSFADRDFATAESLRDQHWEAAWPQTGERVTSSEAMRAIIEAYPGGPWQGVERRLIGAEDSLVVTPLGQVVRIAGNGDTWAAEWVNRYPDGTDWFVIDVIQLRDGKVFRETTYWAQVLDAPPWQRDWVELDPSGLPKS